MPYLKLSRPIRAALITLPLLFSVAGCGSGGTVLVPVLGGREHVRVEFSRGGTGHDQADGFATVFAGFIPNVAPKPPDFGFTLSVSAKTPPPRQITVEDITEDNPVLFFKDEKPVVEIGRWHGLIEAIDAHDPRLAWLYRLNNDVRIYRFTIIAADGHTVVLNQASNYPAFIKNAIRVTYGEKL